MRLFNGDAFLDELAWACGCSPKDLISLIKQLQKEGLITQEVTETEHGKRITFIITKKGDELTEDIIDGWLENKKRGKLNNPA